MNHSSLERLNCSTHSPEARYGAQQNLKALEEKLLQHPEQGYEAQADRDPLRVAKLAPRLTFWRYALTIAASVAVLMVTATVLYQRHASLKQTVSPAMTTQQVLSSPFLQTQVWHFNQQPLAVILQELAHHYHRPIRIDQADRSLPLISARFSETESLDDILALLMEAGELHYTSHQQGDTLLIQIVRE